MGHLLMRVTAEEFLDAQPVRDARAGLTLIADARLDNRDELGTALGMDPRRLRESPDSLLLLMAYRRWNKACVEHLIGDFVFVVWDATRRELVLVRDHMGQRAVFYHRGEDFFAFASEPKGLWALPEVPRELSQIGIGRLLVFERGVERGTGFERISAVPGGTVMTVAAGKAVDMRRYWAPRADPVHVGRDEAYYVQAYRRVLGEAVACRLRRNIYPAALLFAGGFDSGAIAGLAGPVVTTQGRKLIAVSSVLPSSVPDRPGNARRSVELFAQKMPHLDVHFITREGLDIFSGMEAGFLQSARPHSVNRYTREALERAAKAAGAPVLMEGFGGDYTLNHREPGWLGPHHLRAHVRRFVSEFRAYRWGTSETFLRALYGQVIRPLLPSRLQRSIRRFRLRLPIFGSPMPLSATYKRRLCAAGVSFRRGPISRAGDPRLVSLNLLRDKQESATHAGSVSAAASGLEFTAPYHDKRVIELALAIPEAIQAKHGRSRHLARTALADVYPAEFQRRGTANDDLIPDFLAMIERVRPRLLDEIDRMQREGYLARYFDFDRMRTMLARDAPSAEAGEQAARLATRAVLFGRYIEWFERDNRPPP